jgi:hypothetical protein
MEVQKYAGGNLELAQTHILGCVKQGRRSIHTSTRHTKNPTQSLCPSAAFALFPGFARPHEGRKGETAVFYNSFKRRRCYPFTWDCRKANSTSNNKDEIIPEANALTIHSATLLADIGIMGDWNRLIRPGMLCSQEKMASVPFCLDVC